ncbi:MAG: helix-turn-helix transcriptional regulator [Clostridia bacterium]|nr:helix-turn-helix transcriptional regulator [Clostridia bacterium]
MKVRFFMRLKEIREELNISQKELAEKLKVSPTNVYNYENGRTEPSIDMLIKIADLLNVSIDYLVGRSNENELLSSNNIKGENHLEKELFTLFNSLDRNNQNRVIGYAYALVK